MQESVLIQSEMLQTAVVSGSWLIAGQMCIIKGDTGAAAGDS